MRGKWAERPDNVKVLNVTSAQGHNQNRKDFSPMSASNYKGFHCFENYWQSGKVFEGVDPAKHRAWWESQTEGKRRYPGGKGKRVLHSNYDGVIRDYVRSRKEIYVPEYYSLMVGTESFQKWKKAVESGMDIVVYDFDGPRSDTGEPLCVEVTLDTLKVKINDTRFPFGHGYVVAAGILGISPENYCD